LSFENRFCLDRSTLGRVLRERTVGDFRLTEVAHPGGLRLGRHAHRFPTISIILEGAVREAIDDTEHHSVTGEVMFKNGGETHWDIVGDGGAHYFVLETLSPERSHVPPGRIPACRKKRGLATALALAAYRAFDAEEDRAELCAQELCAEFVADVGAFQGVGADSLLARRIGQAVDFIRARIPAPVRMDEVARAVGVHPVYLARLFRRFRGCSLATFVRRCRVEHAVGLLRSDDPLARIALAAGFFDQSHFTHAFHRVVGMPPAQMRRLMRGKR